MKVFLLMTAISLGFTTMVSGDIDNKVDNHLIHRMIESHRLRRGSLGDPGEVKIVEESLPPSLEELKNSVSKSNIVSVAGDLNKLLSTQDRDLIAREVPSKFGALVDAMNEIKMPRGTPPEMQAHLDLTVEQLRRIQKVIQEEGAKQKRRRTTSTSTDFQQDAAFSWLHSQNRGQFQVKSRHIDIQDALQKRDQSRIRNFIDSSMYHIRSGGTGTSQSSRRMSDGAKGNKYDQCKLLADCSKKLTLYDFFIYVFNTGIDFVQGTIKFDSDLIFYDNGYNAFTSGNGYFSFGFFDKFNSIKSTLVPNAEQLLAATNPAFTAGDACDNLLDVFHRPETVPEERQQHVNGIVTEVCLAQGNPEYISLTEMNKFIPSIAQSMLASVLRCSADLHNDSSSFVFQDNITRQFRYPDGFTDKGNSEVYGTHGEYLSTEANKFYTFGNYFTKDLTSLLKPFGSSSEAYDLETRQPQVYEQLIDTYIEWFLATGNVTAPEFGLQCIQEDSTACPQDVVDLALPCHQDFFSSCYEYQCKLQLVEMKDDGCSGSSCAIFMDTPTELQNIPTKFEWTEVWPDDCQDCTHDICTTNVGSFYVDEVLEDAPYDPINGGTKIIRQEVMKDIDRGLEMVLGEKTALGYVCGLTSVPGTCCLDAPKDSGGPNGLWGIKYVCGDVCRNPGPKIAGINAEACDVYAGTFCFSTDCTELRDCVQAEINAGSETGRPAFKEYLRQAPTIADPLNEVQCGSLREYFGFEPTFNNDFEVCEEMKQLRNTRDFDILDNFFQGEDGGVDPPGGPAPDCPVTLKLPAEGFSEEGALAWRIANFVFSNIVRVGENNFAIVEEFKCIPCIDPATASPAIAILCDWFRGIVAGILTVIVTVLKIVLAVSEGIYNALADIETTATKDIIDQRFCRVGENDGVSMCRIFDEVKCKPVGKLGRGHGCDGKDSDCQNGPDDCLEDVYLPEIDFSQVNANCGGHIFATKEDAAACVDSFASVADDCYEVDTSINTFNVTSDPNARISTCGWTFEVEITGTEHVCFKSKSSTFSILVHDSLRQGHTTCELPEGPDAPPMLDLTTVRQRCAGKTFWKSIDDAIDCTKAHVVARDPCRKVDVNVEVLGSIGLPGCVQTEFYEIQVTAHVVGCSSVTTSDIATVLVDPNIEGLACQFSSGPELFPSLETATAHRQCQKRIFQSPGDAEACFLAYSDASDDSGGCRPVNVSASSSVHGSTLTADCGTQFYDVTVKAKLPGCGQTYAEDTVTLVVDQGVLEPGCLFSASPALPPMLKTANAILYCTSKVFSSVGAAEACVSDFSKAEDPSKCREVVLSTSAAVNTDLTLEACETEYYDITITATIAGCLSLAESTTLTVVVDPNTNSNPTCEFSSRPYLPPLLNTTDTESLCVDRMYPSIEAAESCILDSVEVEDVFGGCRSVQKSVSSSVSASGTIDGCGTKEFNVIVTAEVAGCAPVSTEASFLVIIDEGVQEPNCAFTVGPNAPPLLDTARAHAECAGKMFPSSEAAINCVSQFINAEDAAGCRKAQVSIVAEVDGGLTLTNCGTLHMTIKTEVEIAGCSPLQAANSIPVTVDPNVKGSSACQGLHDPNISPLLDVAEAARQCSSKIFPSVERAESCLLELAQVEDQSGNCRQVVINTNAGLDLDRTLQNCGTGYIDINISASILSCGALETEKTLTLLVDQNVQDPSCDFSLGPNISPKLDLTGAKDQCVGKMFKTIQAAEECVRELAKTEDVSGGCRPVLLSVTSSSVNAEKTLDSCETEIIDLTVTTEIQGCSSLKAEEVLTFAVDSNLQTPSCSYSLDPNTPPLLDLTDAIGICTGRIFHSLESAEACVLTFSKASDQSGGCRPVNVNVISVVDTFLSLQGCGTQHVTATVSAAIGGCANTTVQDSLALLIDPQAIDSGCHVLSDPNLPPTLEIADVRDSCMGKFFPSIAAAEACVLDFAKSLDPTNCRTVTTTVDSVLITNGQCGTSYVDITVTSEINNCSALQVNETISLLVDPNVQDPSCDFSLGPNISPKLDLTDAKDQCVGKMFQTIQAAEACVQEFAKIEDVSGGCRPVLLNVTSQVNTTLSLDSCGSLYIDVQATAFIADCQSTFTDETLLLVVDPSIRENSCDCGSLGIYNNPVVNVSYADCEGIFSTLEEAKDCVRDTVVAVDVSNNCRPISIKVNATQVGSCGHEITATATIESCEALQTISGPPVKVHVDATPPEVSCSFTSASIDESGAGVFVNPGLEYSVTDNCDGDTNEDGSSGIKVVLESFSNEFDTLNPGMATQTRTFSAVEIDSLGNVREFFDVDVYVSAAICANANSGKCVTDPSAEGRRFYVTDLTATDKAGLVSHARCSVEVKPSGSGGLPFHDGSFDQLFKLDSTVYELLPSSGSA